MIHIIQAIWYWIEVHTGTVNESGPYYGFWSGFGSDIGEVTLIGGLFAVWKGTRCHIDKCNRHGKHSFQHYKLCKRHHPGVPKNVTYLSIMKLHKASKK